MPERVEGRILKGIGGFYYVLCGEEVVECKAGGRLRLGEESPVAGDLVEIERQPDGRGFITGIRPRRSVLTRPPVANIDQLMIIVSEAPPRTDPLLVDKTSVIALRQGIAPVIVINKSDLERGEKWVSAYETAGFPVLEASAETGEGIPALQARLRGKITAFTGNSGVGKSSLLNRLDSRLALEVGDISRKIARGKNTTRQVEFLPVEGGGLVADTPGFSAFDITRMERLPKELLEQYFPEIAACFNTCRFSGCAHLKEPGCRVKELVERGEIARSRYESYARIYEELKALKEWEE